jgi:hypothetical protein
MQAELELVRDWAKAKLQGGSEPPWAWFRYMQLVETVDAILAGMAATVTMESSPQSGPHPGGHLRLVDSTCPQDTAQPHHVEPPILLPM